MLIPASGVKLPDGFRSQREALVFGTKSAGWAILGHRTVFTKIRVIFMHIWLHP